jgi:pyruvate dehydrogenase E1 component alpha subunit
MIWAASFSAPVVFFCQNNQYAISVPLERQSRVPLYQRAAGFGFPACGSTATTSSPSSP